MIDNTLKLSKKMRKEIGRELWHARQDRNLYIYQVVKRTHIPIDLIDAMELGLKLYGKEMKFCFE